MKDSKKKSSLWLDHDRWKSIHEYIKEKESNVIYKMTGWLGYSSKEIIDIDDEDEDIRI
jgi:hypothetical protein